ncbi:MAG: SOS response-associated peptidase, partial [Syntrophomonadaceae bacterium]|nr:SOS response-associated peptidase [Syntrophomonadaceae bacterium]
DRKIFDTVELLTGWQDINSITRNNYLMSKEELYMCGRYTLTVDKETLSERFGCSFIVPDYRPRYNAAPTQSMPVVLQELGQRNIMMMRWGMIPRWAKDSQMGSKLINARIETVAEKPAFRDSFQKRRCIIPADGYYEWLRLGQTKQPMRIVLKSRELFGFAGLWDNWIDGEGKSLFTFSIITTAAIGSVRHIHHRMPLILTKEDEAVWLQEGLKIPPVEAVSCLTRIKSLDNINAYPVGSLVNSPAYDNPELIIPARDF